MSSRQPDVSWYENCLISSVRFPKSFVTEALALQTSLRCVRINRSSRSPRIRPESFVRKVSEIRHHYRRDWNKFKKVESILEKINHE
ncbi:1274_t:CDS:2 [Funneliformis mosseae]|uniref:1274_t:CDS:1 n=1 Tax=Funneliformis mosseae TaxID=27381 RepID=A0A9N9FBC1_FUNMO|nr:1274_t:CDS:2 [Funneliformis mosseae]